MNEVLMTLLIFYAVVVAAAIKISCQSDFAKWMVKQKGRAPRRAPNSLKRLTSHLL